MRAHGCGEADARHAKRGAPLPVGPFRAVLRHRSLLLLNDRHGGVAPAARNGVAIALVGVE
jgi:hypothetical protein